MNGLKEKQANITTYDEERELVDALFERAGLKDKYSFCKELIDEIADTAYCRDTNYIECIKEAYKYDAREVFTLFRCYYETREFYIKYLDELENFIYDMQEERGDAFVIGRPRYHDVCHIMLKIIIMRLYNKLKDDKLFE